MLRLAADRAARPLLGHVIGTAQSPQPAAIAVVYGHGGDQARAAFAGVEVGWALQAEQFGAGHAVMQAMPSAADDQFVLILYGDVTRIRPETLARLVALADPRADARVPLIDCGRPHRVDVCVCFPAPVGGSGPGRANTIKIGAVSLDSTIVKVHPDGTGVLRTADRKPSAGCTAAGAPKFIWSRQALDPGAAREMPPAAGLRE